MLLERLDASRDLSTMQDDLAAAQIIAELLVQLNSVPAPAGMRRLSDVAAATLAGTPDAIRLAADPDERQLLINCAARFEELITDRIDSRLLHWDLHYYNTLSTLDERTAVEGDRSETAERRFRRSSCCQPCGTDGTTSWRPAISREPCCAVSTS